MHRQLLATIFVLSLGGCDSQSESSGSRAPAPDTVSPTALASPDTGGWETQVVIAGRTIVVPLVDAISVAEIPSADGSVWGLVSGVECEDCDAPRELHLFDLRSPMQIGRGKGYPFPGDHIEAGEEKPFYRSRTFVGTCLPDRRAGVVWLQDDVQSDLSWVTTVRFVIPGKSVADSTFAADSTLIRALSEASDNCKEIAGANQYIL